MPGAGACRFSSAARSCRYCSGCVVRCRKPKFSSAARMRVRPAKSCGFWGALAAAGGGGVMTILNTTAFYFVNGYTPTYGSTALHLAPLGNFEVALVVAVTSFRTVAGVRGGIGPVRALADSAGQRAAGGRDGLSCADLAGCSTGFWPAARGRNLACRALCRLCRIAGAAGCRIDAAKGAKFGLCRDPVSVANGIFGSFTPAISTLLIQMTGNRASPALWLSAAAAVSLAAAFSIRHFVPKRALELPA